jgi:hypothetical protein
MIRARKCWVVRHLRFFCFSAMAGAASRLFSVFSFYYLRFVAYNALQLHPKPLMTVSESFAFASINGHLSSCPAPASLVPTPNSPSTTAHLCSSTDGPPSPADKAAAALLCRKQQPGAAEKECVRVMVRCRACVVIVCRYFIPFVDGAHLQLSCVRVLLRWRGAGGGLMPC